MVVKTKICGLKEPYALTAAMEAGADFVGLNFYPPSPRYVEIEVAKYLANYVPATVTIVGLFVDPDDDVLENTLNDVRIDMIQLHGSESPARVEEIRETFDLPVMKVLPVTGIESLDSIADYEEAADWLMFDARGDKLPGGNGITFDWTILQDRTFKKPWMLAGGLTSANVVEALSILSPTAVDVSSGVESAPGVKDSEKIHDFIKLALSAQAR